MKTIACEHCATKYRVDPERFSSPTPRIRCKKCGEVFTATFEDDSPAPVSTPAPIPQPTLSPPPDTPVPATAVPAPQAVAPENSPSVAPTAAAPAGGDKILIAHENKAIAANMQERLEGAGFVVVVKNDGVQALVELETGGYRAGVLDVALPKMFGFEVCEVIRRDSQLDSTKLILVAAIYHKDRYRRNPSELYGADDFIEKQSLEEDLVSTVQRCISGETVTPASSSAPPVAPPMPPSGADVDTSDAPAALPDSPPQAPGDASASESVAPSPTPAAADGEVAAAIDKKALEKARRTGRVMVSDLALYNVEIFAKAKTPQDIYDALHSDVQECRSQIKAKVSEDIQAFEDVLEVAIVNYLAKHSNG